ncbi:winged helix-turn-helix transcriptional regulator [Diaminobutyricibacter tongyongensis]|uniref:Winged helix-turn-helix transcriptional regulator n=1 Tax=Leifsonia tongyongensis TaxID=1268043 RepID=A0A6L9Y2Z0_9MICO|nr:metalloregulator ArsR/SmtB family transcription factor [Diaminobutyricibacter tongyongensis]NEN08003.1 winged helix-turn-helix transcriptional regulator [Diaminobutyricibacter tongyongensis]
MADIFDVIADATRREILRVLLDRYVDDVHHSGEISVSEIVAKLELSQPTVSKHLKVLRDSGLVKVREEGQHRYYQLDSEPLEDVEDWVIPFLSSDFDQVDVREALAQETREFAGSVGKVLADTSHRVTTAVEKVTPRKWRRD